MKSTKTRLGAILITAIVGAVMTIPASASMQSETALPTVNEFDSSAVIASASSNAVRITHPESAMLPAGPNIGSPAPIPVAPALIAPVRNERKILRESRPELPKKTFFSLALLQHSAVAFDAWSTRNLVDNGGRELNPVLKPFAHSAALYPVMQTWPTAIDYLAARMARSNKPWMRRIWWVPQTASAATSIVIGFRNVSLANSSQKLVK